MMKTIPVWRMTRGILSIFEEKPGYEKGCDGSNGKCDCIGMQRGAGKREGVEDIKGMDGTNYALRHTYKNVQKIKSKDQLREGDIVLKFRNTDDKDMPLPLKYRRDGTDYSTKWGEMNCTHTGYVSSADPLVITHMTSPTAMQDTKLGKWSYFGQLPFVDYEDREDPAEDEPETQTAYVYAASGKTVKMRAKPSSLCRLYWDVPVGSEVEVSGHDGNWTHISWAGRDGWMKSEYLVNGKSYMRYTVTISGLDETQANALLEQYPKAIKEAEVG